MSNNYMVTPGLKPFRSAPDSSSANHQSSTDTFAVSRRTTSKVRRKEAVQMVRATGGSGTRATVHPYIDIRAQ
jgi:hypothetical protein